MELLKEHQPDFILSEIVLRQGATGEILAERFDILREAKRILPERPVYLITACDFPEFREKAKELGADGYLVKPFTQDALLHLLPGP